MERRVTSHTEEEEMNQRRRLLTLARKGDQKSIELLFELYQVKVFSGDELKKKKLPSFPVVVKPISASGKSGSKALKVKEDMLAKASPSEPKKKKAQTGAPKPLSKGPSKLKSQDLTVKTSSATAIKKGSPSSTKKQVVKKVTPPKVKASAGKSIQKKLDLVKKPRIAKKK